MMERRCFLMGTPDGLLVARIRGRQFGTAEWHTIEEYDVTDQAASLAALARRTVANEVDGCAGPADGPPVEGEGAGGVRECAAPVEQAQGEGALGLGGDLAEGAGGAVEARVCGMCRVACVRSSQGRDWCPECETLYCR